MPWWGWALLVGSLWMVSALPVGIWLGRRIKRRGYPGG
jgi:hypothetical protein